MNELPGEVPWRGAEDLRRAYDCAAEGVQRAPGPLQQAGLRPPLPPRLHGGKAFKIPLLSYPILTYVLMVIFNRFNGTANNTLF